MKREKIIYLLMLTVSLFLYSNIQAQQTETLINEAIISMTKAGLSQEIIVQKIYSSRSAFDLSTDSLIELKQAEVSEEVIEAMLKAKIGVSGTDEKAFGNPNDPMSPHSFGIYLFEELNETRSMFQLMPNVSVQNRVGGKITSALVPFGFGKVKTKMNLSGKNADLQISNSKPVFYFYLDAKSGGLNTRSGIPASPKEITLIKFNIHKNEREIAISKENRYGVKGGLSDEYVVEFKFEDLGNGRFRVIPKEPLKAGEYAFYLLNSGNSNVSSGIGTKFFDFGIKGIN